MDIEWVLPNTNFLSDYTCKFISKFLMTITASSKSAL